MTSKDQLEVEKHIQLINTWRFDHLIILKEINTEISNFLKNISIKPKLTSSRLKRFESIQYKLDINPSMGLGGMQDIGGYRVVVNNKNELQKILNLLSKTELGNFVLENIDNYIESPKSSGYRSIHFRYKYKSEDTVFDGLRIELQIRTKLQHSWATAVETAGLYTQTPLKSSQGPESWLDFFKIVSSLFAYVEKLPIIEEHKTIPFDELMKEFYKVATESNCINILRALKITASYVKSKTFSSNDYCLLKIESDQKKINITKFSKAQEVIAMQEYTKLEAEVLKDGNKNAVVLVSVKSIEDLKKAYPSFFLDTTDFINNMERTKIICEYFNLR